MQRVLRVQDERLILAACRKDQILQRLRGRGLRITKQRRLLLDIIFEQECTSCKEIYYQALKRDKNVGIATVYRMINVLTELGVFQVHAPYQLVDPAVDSLEKGCRLVLKNQVVDLDPKEWQEILVEVLKKKGYTGNPEIQQVIL